MSGFRGQARASETLGCEGASLLGLFFYTGHKAQFCSAPQLKFPDDLMFLFSSTFLPNEVLFVCLFVMQLKLQSTLEMTVLLMYFLFL